MNNTIIFFLIFSFLLYTACSNEKEDKNAGNKINVKTVRVTEKEFTFPVYSTGRVYSDKEMKLSFKTGGIIHAIHAKEGENVTKGTLLAQLDLSEISAKVNQAEQAVEKTKRDLERTRRLYNDSVTTLEQLQNTETAFDIAQSDLNIARFNLRYSKIKAPSNGKILKIFMEENELISAGHPVFIFASTESNWIIKTNITDKDLVKISIGDTASIHFDAYPEDTFKGEVKEIGRFADPYTGTFEVQLTLNDKQKVSNGFIGNVVIYPKERKTYKVIPVDAMVEANNMQAFVYGIENNKPKKIKIKIHSIKDDQILVQNGIEKDMMVITEGVNYIDPDSEISINSKK